jgi:hypothetical protein
MGPVKWLLLEKNNKNKNSKNENYETTLTNQWKYGQSTQYQSNYSK